MGSTCRDRFSLCQSLLLIKPVIVNNVTNILKKLKKQFHSTFLVDLGGVLLLSSCREQELWVTGPGNIEQCQFYWLWMEAGLQGSTAELQGSMPY